MNGSVPQKTAFNYWTKIGVNDKKTRQIAAALIVLVAKSMPEQSMSRSNRESFDYELAAWRGCRQVEAARVALDGILFALQPFPPLNLHIN